MKLCTSGCSKKPKPLDDFYHDPKSSDGRKSKCKACTLLQAKAKRDANLELARRLDKVRSYHRREYQQRYYQKRKERLKQKQV